MILYFIIEDLICLYFTEKLSQTQVTRLLQAGLNELAPDEANRIADTINQIVVNQRHRERDRDKKREKRHKTIFDEH